MSSTNDPLAIEIAERIDALADALDGLGVARPPAHTRVVRQAERLAAELRAGERGAIKRLGALVDLDDVDDARSSLGIALAGVSGDVVPQAFAAAVLDVSRPRVVALVNEGRLEAVETDGGRAVRRSSLAARLAAR